MKAIVDLAPLLGDAQRSRRVYHGLSPELVEFREAILRSVPGQDGPGHSANRCTDHPIGTDAVVMKPLVCACMVSAQRIPAAQNKSDLRCPVHAGLVSARRKRGRPGGRPKSREEKPRWAATPPGPPGDAALQHILCNAQ